VFSQGVLKLGTLAPADSDWIKAINDVFDEVLRKSTEKPKVIFYSGGVMGDEDEMIRKIRIGQLHGGGFTTLGIKKIAPELSVLDLPMLFRNEKEVDFIFDKFLPDFENFFEKRGFKLLLLTEQGFSYFFTTRKDVSKLKDLGKTRMWGWKDERVILSVVKVLGSNPIFVLVPDVLSALETGMLETVDLSPMACISLQWCNLMKVMINYPYRFEAGALVIYKKSWDALPSDFKVSLETALKQKRQWITEKIREGNKRSIERLKMMNIKFVDVSYDEINWFHDEVRKKIWYAENTEYSHEFLRRIEEELENFRKGKSN
jgi:TRAP-type C4-dicarboxylate transport system substrate-binding protein